ncbi:MAG TPA: hypothetical protein VHK88_06935, partial [Aquihabitans sp.]|nr:hypothetical protein [Aquihabitans sp.]
MAATTSAGPTAGKAGKEGAERSDALVLFGATGDLAHKKIFPAVYQLEAAGRLEGPIIGVASSEGDDEFLRGRARASLDDVVGDVDAEVADRLLAKVHYVSGDYREQQVYADLAKVLEGCTHPLFYLAIPPTLFDDVITGLHDCGVTDDSRVVVE